MASKLVQLQSKAAEASKFVAKHGTSYYRQLLEQNKQYIQEPPTVEKCNLLSKQLFYTRLSRFVTLSCFCSNYLLLYVLIVLIYCQNSYPYLFYFLVCYHHIDFCGPRLADETHGLPWLVFPIRRM